MPGIYDDVMQEPEDGAALGIGAATAPGIQAADEPFLPQMSQQEFDSVFAPTGTPQVTTSGSPDARGPAMHAEEMGRSANTQAGRIIGLAKSFVGTPYVWGGSSPNGFDCSGLVQYVYGQFGVKLPRVSFQQAAAGKRINLKGAQAGDLVFWDNSSRNNGADHVAISLGNGYIIEAPRPGAKVRIRKLSARENAWAVRVL